MTTGVNPAISVIVHSASKVGKSTLANTSPAPRLLLDVEAAYRFLDGAQTFWDPMQGPPPNADGTWETCVVKVFDYKTFQQASMWLRSGHHPFNSVIVDSITELQVRCKNQIRSENEDMDQRRWGALLDHMEGVIRELRDLTEHPTKPISALVVTAMTTNREGRWRAYVQGQLAVKLPYFFDVIGYLYVEPVRVNPDDPTDLTTVDVRRMLVGPHPQIEAGERVQGRLPTVIDVPQGDKTIPRMLSMIFIDTSTTTAVS